MSTEQHLPAMRIVLVDDAIFTVNEDFVEFCSLLRIHRENCRKSGAPDNDWTYRVNNPNVKKADVEVLLQFLRLFNANHPHSHLVKNTMVIKGLPSPPIGPQFTIFVGDSSDKNCNDRSNDGPYTYNPTDSVSHLPEWVLHFFDRMDEKELESVDTASICLGASLYTIHSSKYLYSPVYSFRIKGSRPSDRPPLEWSVDDVRAWARNLGYEQLAEKMRSNGIHGKALFYIGEDGFSKLCAAGEDAAKVYSEKTTLFG